MQIKFNQKFPLSSPYGIILTGRLFFSCLLLIIICFMKYHYDGIGLVIWSTWFFGFWSALSFTAHIFGLQYNLSDSPGAIFYIPFAFLDFFIGLFGAFFHGIGTLICLVSLFDAARHSTGFFINYFLATINCALLVIVFGYYSLLIYRKTPNGKLLAIREMIVQGDNITHLNLPTINNSASGMSPVQPNHTMTGVSVFKTIQSPY
uniref:MARVEL domain-containing protein n=1 Tax=Strongyloides venezuelensis TaxID=75913 RepID=A0A0K0F0K5_STRVS